MDFLTFLRDLFIYVVDLLSPFEEVNYDLPFYYERPKYSDNGLIWRR